MPAFQAKKLVKGVSDETEVSDLQGTLAGRSRESASLTLTSRDAAAHLLESLFHSSALQRWRQVIDAGASKPLPVVVTAMSYVAEFEDVERLEPFLDDPICADARGCLAGSLACESQQVR